MQIKTNFFWLVIFAILYVLLELWCAIGLKILHEARDVDYAPFPAKLIETFYQEPLRKLLARQAKYIDYSRELGWTIKPGGKSPKQSANSQGIRADRDYDLKSPHGKLRVAAFGDSFTHGSNVVNRDTWTEALGREDPRLEVLNFGVGGYGLDQAFLRYRKDGMAYRPGIVLIGYMSDDLIRHVNTFRPFVQTLTGLPLAKPRFLLEGSKLVLAPNPMQSVEDYRALLDKPEETLARLGTNDIRYQHAYRPGPLDFLPSVRFVKELVQFFRYPDDALFIRGEYNENSEAYRVTEKIFDEFVRTALDQGSLPVIIIFPNTSDLRDYRRFGTREYAPLLRHFEQQGYLYIDALHVFDGDAAELELEEIIKGHYTPLGNKLVGEYLYRYMVNDGLLDRATRQTNMARLRQRN